MLEIHPSARKHGIIDEDIAHAVSHPMCIDDRDSRKTASGELITDELIEKLSAEAEAGYDVDEILRSRRGRPLIGSGPATVESVRLDPELREALTQRAERDHEATSSVIRKALRQYLGAG